MAQEIRVSEINIENIKNVSYGKAYYELFGETIRKRTDVQDTITVYETLLSKNNTIIKNEINEHKSHIKFS